MAFDQYFKTKKDKCISRGKIAHFAIFYLTREFQRDHKIRLICKKIDTLMSVKTFYRNIIINIAQSKSR